MLTYIVDTLVSNTHSRGKSAGSPNPAIGLDCAPVRGCGPVSPLAKVSRAQRLLPPCAKVGEPGPWW
eukprot:108232-Karenia_brevis.AAC.1